MDEEDAGESSDRYQNMPTEPQVRTLRPRRAVVNNRRPIIVEESYDNDEDYAGYNN
jgi:hypothetical protein